MKNKIIVAYWTGSAIEEVGIDHQQEFDYSDKKRNEIIDLILNEGLQLMMYENDKFLCIWIDNGRFRQR